MCPLKQLSPAAGNTNKAELQKLSGTIERITFHNAENGFCVLQVKLPRMRDLATITGCAAMIAPGEFIECEGQWINNKSYGLQFQASQLRTIPPSTLEGMEKYLASGLIKGIGKQFAKRLVRRFKEEVFTIIEEEPERLLEVDGIGKLRQKRLVASWDEQKVVRDIMVFLQSHGVGTSRAVRIYKTYGDNAVECVRENPYRLSNEIYGIGFKTADQLAQRLGIPNDSILRAQAGVRHALMELSNQGHCAAEHQQLVELTANLLEIDATIVEQGIQKEVAEGNLISEPINDKACFFIQSLYLAEVGVAKHLTRLNQGGKGAWHTIDVQRAIPWVQAQTGLTLSASQKEAVSLALQSKVLVITGGPGVGKTTLVNSILRIIRAKGAKIILAAPTGRAAKRLSESTGMPAKTIHRLLEFDNKSFGFKRNDHNPLSAELVVIDEASMIDIYLMHHLVKAIPTYANLLIVGDIDQLPSVGPGSVLGDIISAKVIPVVRLTEIFRQAAMSKIITNAHRVNQGYMPISPEDNTATSDFYIIPADTPEAIHDKLMQVVTQRIPQRFNFHPVQDIQVLTPMNRGGLGARALNESLQKRLNSEAQPVISRFGWRFAPNDKVIQLVNNYDKDVFNGDLGIIRHISVEDSTLTIEFDGRGVNYDFDELDEIGLAYATTIHKSQGSEYPVVVMPLSTQHYTLLERNLLYTGITRGKQLVVLIVQKRALGMAVKNRRSRTRLTNLCARLRKTRNRNT